MDGEDYAGMQLSLKSCADKFYKESLGNLRKLIELKKKAGEDVKDSCCTNF